MVLTGCTAFIVLYPVGGISSEMWLMYQALPFIKEKNLYANLFIGLPFGYYDFVKQISGKGCKNDCSGQVICNYELGQCRCFHGYSGEGCAKRLQLNCNHPASPEPPDGR